jgi:hypothetical protein
MSIFWACQYFFQIYKCTMFQTHEHFLKTTVHIFSNPMNIYLETINIFLNMLTFIEETYIFENIKFYKIMNILKNMNTFI